jgi:HEAT repeat protein
MKRHLVLVVALAALGLAGVSLFLFRGEGTTSHREEEHSTAWLGKLENRLNQLETRLKDALARLEGLPSSPTSYERRGSPEGAQLAASDLQDEIAKLGTGMNDLSYRIQALEEKDPINRGYTFLSSENAQLRLEGIKSLRRLAQFDPGARKAIRDMLNDPNERVRQEAADALGDLGDKEAAPLLARMLGDPDAGVREKAIDALGKVGASEAGASIAQLLSDPSGDVRKEAADVLGRLKAREGTNALLQALTDSNEDVRGEAIASLGEVGAVEAVPYLKQMYETNPGRHLIRLITALRALGDEGPFQQEVVRLSQVALSSDDARAREEAVQTLSRFAREEARDVFTQALQDPSDRVRREAERGLRGRD